MPQFPMNLSLLTTAATQRLSYQQAARVQLRVGKGRATGYKDGTTRMTMRTPAFMLRFTE